MKFFERDELSGECDATLRGYDAFVRARVGEDYPYPLRMRDWELWQVLQRLPAPSISRPCPTPTARSTRSSASR